MKEKKQDHYAYVLKWLKVERKDVNFTSLKNNSPALHQGGTQLQLHVTQFALRTHFYMQQSTGYEFIKMHMHTSVHVCITHKERGIFTVAYCSKTQYKLHVRPAKS